MVRKLLVYSFIIFLLLGLLLDGELKSVHSIISLSIPLMYLIKHKGYYMFKFDIKDTLQSVTINAGSALILSLLLIFITSFTGEFKWVLLFGLSTYTILKILLFSFLQELLFRFLIQGELVQMHGLLKGVLFTSVLTSVMNYSTIWVSLIYLLISLIIGWVFEKTKDIYGVTLAHFITSLCVNGIV